MSERFFVATPIAGDHTELRGDEARHLAASMRARAGDEVILFDGSGAEYAARVLSVGKPSVQLQIVQRHEISRELPRSITLAVALPKGERQKWLIEKATELGVARIIPLLTERGIAQPTELAIERLRRGVIEASKQCGRNRLMEIAAPQTAVTFFGAQSRDNVCRLFGDPHGIPLPSQVAANAADSSVTAAIGPEGGFTDAETAAARAAGWHGVSLGPAILRVETAAIAFAAWAATTVFSVGTELSEPKRPD